MLLESVEWDLLLAIRTECHCDVLAFGLGARDVVVADAHWLAGGAFCGCLGCLGAFAGFGAFVDEAVFFFGVGG